MAGAVGAGPRGLQVWERPLTLWLLILAWSFAPVAAALYAVLARRSARLSVSAQVATDAGPLVLLRPAAGAEPELYRSLASSRHVPRDASVRFLLASIDDAAYPCAEAVAEELRGEGVDAACLITGATKANKKADQIARALSALPRRPGQVLAVVDSDVELDERSLAGLLGPIATGESDVAWAVPVETEPRTLADHLSATILGGSLHAFALLSRLDDRGMVGKCFAMRRELYADLDPHSFVATLGEDMDLARRITQRGGRLTVQSEPVRSLAKGRSLREVWARYRRWITVIRAQRPHLLPSYPLLFACTPILLVLSGVLAIGGDASSAIGTASAALLARASVASVARAASRRPTSFGSLAWLPWLALAADLLLLVAFVGALASRRVVWRGTPLIVRNGAAEVDG